MNAKDIFEGVIFGGFLLALIAIILALAPEGGF